MATFTKFSFPVGATVLVQAFSNAAYTQTVTIAPPSGTAAVFQGSGEGNTELPLTTSGFLTAKGVGTWPSFVSVAGVYKVSVSANGSASQVLGASLTLNTPSGGQIIFGNASSEDSGDNDWDDSVTLFTSYVS